ncbi:MAG: P-loop NTPase [Firmicutes bacterium]|nr:P-loop NTPase [Bacillota bacterium]
MTSVPPRLRQRAIAVTSGKGGVGKSNISLNLALAWAERGSRVLVVDADFGLGTLEVLLDVLPTRHLGDWLDGRATFEQIRLPVAERVDLMAAGSGLWELASLPGERVSTAILQMAGACREYDLVLLDTGAGVGPQVLGILAAVGEVLVVTTPEPTAVTEAYTMFKALRHVNPDAAVYLLVNQATDASGRETAEQLALATQRFLDWQPTYVGAVPNDFQVGLAVQERRPFLLRFPQAPAARALRRVAERLRETPVRPRSLPAVLGRVWLSSLEAEGARGPAAVGGTGGEERDALEEARGSGRLGAGAEPETAAAREAAAAGGAEAPAPEWMEIPIDQLRLSPNQRIELVMEDGTHYQTWAEAMEEGRLRVAAPMRRGNWVRLPLGAQMTVRFHDPVASYEVPAALESREDGVWHLRLGETARRQQRRHHVRWACSLPVRFYWWAGDHDGASTASGSGRGRTGDISGGGMLLITEQLLPVGAQLDVQVDLDHRTIAASCRVLRLTKSVRRTAEREEHWYGVEWTAISRRDRDAIVAFIFDQQRRARRKGLL